MDRHFPDRPAGPVGPKSRRRALRNGDPPGHPDQRQPIHFVRRKCLDRLPATGGGCSGGRLHWAAHQRWHAQIQPLADRFWNEIVVPPSVTCTLALKLNPGAAAPGTGPGGDARLASAGVPKTAIIVFTSVGAQI